MRRTGRIQGGNGMTHQTQLLPEDREAFAADVKVGLLATVNGDGLPHLTLITTLEAASPTELTWGQFCEGESKRHIRGNPRTGFLVMSLDRRLWRGRALWTRAETEGDAYVRYNRKPMWRYNAYFGIHTVHFMDLVSLHSGEALPLPGIVAGALLTRLAKGARKTGRAERILTPWAEGLFNRLDALKFLAVIDADGFPAIVPLLQAQAADSRRLVFAPTVYREDLRDLQPGDPVAVLGLTLDMENCLVRGPFAGFTRARGVPLGVIDLDWVYNSMPPIPGQIYPAKPLEPVTRF